MPPQRTMFGGGGGGIPGGGPVTSKLVLGIGVVSLLLSVAAHTPAGQEALTHLLFTPARVLSFELWQVVTYTFVHPIQLVGPIGFIFGLLWLWQIGGEVEGFLGGRRYLGFFVASSGLGAILTIPVTVLLDQTGTVHTGLWGANGALTILFARHYAHREIRLFFVLPVKGQWLIAVSFGLLGLFAIASGPVAVLPEFFAMVLALAFASGLFEPRRAWLRFRAWQIERQLKRRSSRLSVIRGGNGEPGEPGEEPPPAPAKKDDSRGPYLH